MANVGSEAWKEQVRQRKWYNRFDALADELEMYIEKPKHLAQALHLIYVFMDTHRCFGYKKTADYTAGSVTQVIEDRYGS